MPTKHADIFAALCAPFESHEVKIRAAAGGRQLHYITARTAFNRLDEVLGPENWWDEFIPGNDSVMCKLTIRLPDGTTLTKMDAGGYAGMADAGDDDKSGFSDAFKRAAAKFGVARYLYRDGVPSYAGDGAPPPEPQQARQAAPVRSPEPSGDRSDHGPRNGQQRPAEGPYGNLPRSGGALFAWGKKMEEQFGVGLIKYLDQWAKLQDFPRQFKEWDEEQVRLGVEEAVRKLKSIDPGSAAQDEAHVKLQRRNLAEAMRAIMTQRGDESPEAAQHLLNELSGHALVGGEVIHAVATCSDSGLLGRYIAACDDLRRTEANV